MANEGNCPLNETGHYSTPEAATEAFEKQMKAKEVSSDFTAKTLSYTDLENLTTAVNDTRLRVHSRNWKKLQNDLKFNAASDHLSPEVLKARTFGEFQKAIESESRKKMKEISNSVEPAPKVSQPKTEFKDNDFPDNAIELESFYTQYPDRRPCVPGSKVADGYRPKVWSGWRESGKRNGNRKLPDNAIPTNKLKPGMKFQKGFEYEGKVYTMTENPSILGGRLITDHGIVKVNAYHAGCVYLVEEDN